MDHGLNRPWWPFLDSAETHENATPVLDEPPRGCVSRLLHTLKFTGILHRPYVPGIRLPVSYFAFLVAGMTHSLSVNCIEWH
jgi:hypothetical protein